MKWGGAAATVLLLVGWLMDTNILPGGGLLWGEGPFGQIAAGGKMRAWTILVLNRPESWGLFRTYSERPFPSSWRPYTISRPVLRLIVIPGWIPAAAMLIPALLAWRLDTLARRRVRTIHACLNCNYDRAGLAPGAVCPECGSLGSAPA